MKKLSKIHIFLITILVLTFIVISGYSYLTHKAIKDNLRNYNIEAVVDSGRFIIYKDLLQVFKSGDLDKTEELLMLMIKGEESAINQNLSSPHLNDETKVKLKEYLNYEPCADKT
ncbi:MULTISPECIES: hypothetical protein [unclassified Colwellia]|uniref:hypothetical protein n=1 Tax=unclassified Colwellia TaxID=196834 RepID=UPI0015F474B2|nr:MULTISPECIES: hypothetical protein [unclassified Colwellia]MBA6231376.1 hypothetical protein [Colwellia sp. MB02u-7]MBA6235617.1 hypothetical protein [Colwellia sp. MB02u-11]MBA6297976.1 hypothetical protein [Colwellia sp. MB3u-22]MBA6309396.1 hypothetical protein [Colwellia sp. MB3u-64]